MAIISVLQMDVSNNVIVKKHEEEDFNCKTQLVVQQSQEAIFFYKGVAQDVFGPGRYTLDTANLPILNNIIKRVAGDETPFHAEVYFINKVEMMGIKWGTPEPFTIYENFQGSNIPFQVGARGEMSFCVENSRMLIEKMVGTEGFLTQDTFKEKVFNLAVSSVKQVLAKLLSDGNFSIFDIDQRLIELGNESKPLVNEQFEDYGVSLSKFVVTNIKKPEDDPTYKNLMEIKIYAITAQKKENELDILNREKRSEVERQIMEAQGRAQSRSIEGYTYQQEQGFKIAQAAAENTGVGNFTSAGIGIGMMAGVGGVISNQVGNATGEAFTSFGQGGVATGNQQNNMVFCPECGQKIPRGKFCMNCGYKFEMEEPVCKGCGNKLMPGAKFCMNCGTSV